MWITTPKYLLKAKMKTLIEYSLETIQNFFKEEFIFLEAL